MQSLIWIDAICIEQANTQERSHQVRMMGDIYSNAETVLIWLGDADASTPSALQSLYDVVHFCGAQESERDYHYQDLHDLSLPATFDGTALLTFFSAPWFTRTWVLQECKLAKQAICHRGAYTVPWNVVGEAAAMMIARGSAFDVAMRGLDGYASRFTGVVGAALLYGTGKTLQTPMAFMSLNSWTNCKDPKDRVFALLGLLDRSMMRSHEITIDYSHSLEAIYAAATTAVITSCKSLRPLCFAPDTKADCTEASAELFPTWVPRYDRLVHTQRGQRPGAGPHLRASNDIGPNTCFREDMPLMLQAAGVWLGKVSALGRAIGSMPQEHGKMPDWREFLSVDKVGDGVMAPWDTQMRRGRPCSTDHLLELAALFSCDMYAKHYGSEDTSRLLADFSAFLRCCSPYFSGALVPDLAELLKTHESGTEKGRGFLVNPSVLGCHYFETADGMLAIGPGGTRPGDLACILFGCDQPLVLRQQAHGWHIVGTAYVSGVMKVRDCVFYGMAIFTLMSHTGRVYPETSRSRPA